MNVITHICRPGGRPVSVYLADAEPLLADDALCSALPLLPPARQNRVLACRFRRDQALRAAGGLLLRQGFLDAGLAPELLRIERTPAGKPFLPEQPELFFSLSHSGRWAMAAFAAAPVGCDIQSGAHLPAHSGAFPFHPDERAFLSAAQDEAERRTRFFRLWCLKESYLKATGEGLSRPLESFCVHLDGDRPDLPGAAALELAAPEGCFAAVCIIV